jgi:hypothetical protein
VAGAAINVVLITAILSTMLAAMFGLGRMMRSLADEGLAPGWLKDKTDVPYRGILSSGLAMLLSLWLGLSVPEGLSVPDQLGRLRASVHLRRHHGDAYTLPQEKRLPAGRKVSDVGFPVYLPVRPCVPDRRDTEHAVRGGAGLRARRRRRRRRFFILSVISPCVFTNEEIRPRDGIYIRGKRVL